MRFWLIPAPILNTLWEPGAPVKLAEIVETTQNLMGWASSGQGFFSLSSWSTFFHFFWFKQKKLLTCSQKGAKRFVNEPRFSFFFLFGRPRDTKWLRGLPRKPPGPPQSPIFDDFYLIFDWFLCWPDLLTCKTKVSPEKRPQGLLLGKRFAVVDTVAGLR